MRRTLAAVAILAIVVAVLGCGGGSAPAPAPSPTGGPSGPPGGSVATAPAPSEEKTAKPEAKPGDDADDPWGDSESAGGKKTVTGAVGTALFRAITGGANAKGKAPAAPKFGP